MPRKWFIASITVLVLLFGTSTALATDPEEDEPYPWKHHARPFDFKFGAMIDSHQQSRIDHAGILHGFLYIQRTGAYTDDGYPIAEKAHCSSGTCTRGWIIKGVPVTAKLVHVAPRVWLVNEKDVPAEPGYTHFQWVGPPKTPHELEEGQEYDGYLLKRIAPEPFYWLGGSDGSGGSGSGGCGGDDAGDTGGCGGDDAGDTGGCDGDDMGDTGGCGGDDAGDTGGCGGDDMGDTGGCGGDDAGDTGGCGGGDAGDTGGCGGGDTGGSGGNGQGGGSKGHLVEEGVDPHTNIVTTWDGTWTGGCGAHDGGGCEGHDGGCDGH